MEERIKYYLEKVFPHAKITINQASGIMKIYVELEGYFMHESTIDIVNKKLNIILRQVVTDFLEHLHRFVVDEKTYMEIMED